MADEKPPEIALSIKILPVKRKSIKSLSQTYFNIGTYKGKKETYAEVAISNPEYVGFQRKRIKSVIKKGFFMEDGEKCPMKTHVRIKYEDLFRMCQHYVDKGEAKLGDYMTLKPKEKKAVESKKEKSSRIGTTYKKPMNLSMKELKIIVRAEVKLEFKKLTKNTEMTMKYVDPDKKIKKKK